MNTAEWCDWSCAVVVTTERPSDLAPTVATVGEVMAEVSAAADRFSAESDLSRINASAGRFVPVRALTVKLVELSLELAAQTGGAVTPTVGGSLHALGYDDDIDRVRARAEAPARPARPAPAAGTVRVDESLRRVGVSAGTALDLGAIAKAYAVDESVRRASLEVQGPILVSIGGDLAVHRAPDAGWTIAVSEKVDGTSQLVTIESGALATSSTMGRRWAGDRHHIVDPSTGLPAAGRFRTATVWASTAVEANLLSTWALVSADEARLALEKDPKPALLVTTDGTVERLNGWPEPVIEFGAAS